MNQYELIMNSLADTLAKVEDPVFKRDLSWAYDWFELEDFLYLIEQVTDRYNDRKSGS